MFLDLAPDAWPDKALLVSTLTAGLLHEGFERETPLFGPEDKLDSVLPPSSVFHVVDADSSQSKVIEEVRSGRSLVVQGPPGTGKSQTITNIIATAVSEGKRVLFVAEKLAALSVVHDRLVKAGLGDACLELHSRTANKRLIVAELARTLTAGTAFHRSTGKPMELTALRDRLNELTEALHRPIELSGESAFSVLSRQARYIGLGAPPPTVDGAELAGLSREHERALVSEIEQFGELLGEEGAPSAHPLSGIRNFDLQPTDLARLRSLLPDAQQSASRLDKITRALLSATDIKLQPSLSTLRLLDDFIERVIDLPTLATALAQAMLSAPDLSRLSEALEAGATWRALRDEADRVFYEQAFGGEVTALRTGILAGSRSWFARWGSAYRRYSRELGTLLQGALPKLPAERLALVDQLRTVWIARQRLEEDRSYCERVLDDQWRGERTDFVRLLAVARWCERVRGSSLSCSDERIIVLAQLPDRLAQLRRQIKEQEPLARKRIEAIGELLNFDPTVLNASTLLDVDLAAFSDRLMEIEGALDRYGAWARLARLRQSLAGSAARSIAERMYRSEIACTAAVIELRFARAERLWLKAMETLPLLRNINSVDRHELVARFSRLEREHLKSNVERIRASHLANLSTAPNKEMNVIVGEIAKKTRLRAIRRLVSEAPNALQRIKPVMLMSPLSVAQFLPPGSLTFDVLVIDEASQVRPEDAIGAIARAKQLVVVGDKKQLPPSSFFDRLIADDNEEEDDDPEEDDLLSGGAKVAEMESVLTLCEARGLGSRLLSWHYRSRDPSLIRVSNAEFYENRLVLPPSPLQADPEFGLKFTRVGGVYDKGGKRTNLIEGEAIVTRAAEHARKHPDLSLGIVTFSVAQRNLVTELLERARRQNPELDHFLREGQPEDVFVKNIENVQGDERDVILVSVGYGPAIPGGRLTSMSFGPVNSEGGERRLNVLFTRARVRCEVFCSFDPGDIDPSRSKREGSRVLKRFLDFAQSGKFDVVTTGKEADSPFEEDVIEAIRSFGYIADPQVGSAGFKIDIGVRHKDRPGTYILAVECDGAAYHSALWARERDRLRQEVLEHLGWRFHRIWSTDWFYNRRTEFVRLRTALDQARDAAKAGTAIKGANHAGTTQKHDVKEAKSYIPA